MSGRGRVTADPKQAGPWAGHMSGDLALWRGRALRGLEILQGRAECDARRTAAIGCCFGGSTVTHMAFANAPVRGVVSFHGSMPLPDSAGETAIKPEVLICHGAEDGGAQPGTAVIEIDAAGTVTLNGRALDTDRPAERLGSTPDGATPARPGGAVGAGRACDGRPARREGAAHLPADCGRLTRPTPDRVTARSGGSGVS